jgi:hypothetical protein
MMRLTGQSPPAARQSMAHHRLGAGHGPLAAPGQQPGPRAVRRWLPVCHASKEEILARIQRAKQYKEPDAAAPLQQPQQAQQQAPDAPPAAPPAPPPPRQQPQPGGASWLGVLGFSEEEAAAPVQEEQAEGQPEKRDWATSTKAGARCLPARLPPCLPASLPGTGAAWCRLPGPAAAR